MPATRGWQAPAELQLTALRTLPRIGPGDDLAQLILDAARREHLPLESDDVLAVAQKIVSKSEDRERRLAGVLPSDRARELGARTGKDPRLVELILSESNALLRVGREVLIVEHRTGFVLANAGIDQSNVAAAEHDASALLWPLDPDASAHRLRTRLGLLLGAQPPAVLIVDSIGRAWRRGSIGQCIGIAGLAAVRDLRGTPDLNGRPLRATDIAVADELAAAASLLMGQAAESRPAVRIRGLPPGTVARQGAHEAEAGARSLQRAHAEDLFR